MPKFVTCRSLVNKTAVRRETRDGVEHVRVACYTLPDDVVMNGGLYPKDEIEASYQGLERTLAPLEHPEKDGMFISARDPYAIANFDVGAWVENVRREGNRVAHDILINLQVAGRTDRGKRLLDRISELETSEDPRPIHTSVGVFVDVEELDEPQTNAAGKEYTWVARGMVFDHQAILLDNHGAATPEDGVGMAVNQAGEQMPVEAVEVVEETEAADTSVMDLLEQLRAAIDGTIAAEWMTVVDVVGDEVIFETNTGYYQVPFRVDNGAAKIVGIPLRVERRVTYSPKTNAGDAGGDTPKADEGSLMKEMILNALQEAGVKVADDATEAQIMEAYNQHILAANSASDDDGADDLAQIVANAVKPLADKLASIETQMNASTDKERAELAALVANSGKFPGLDAEAAAALPLESLKKLAANCGAAYGVPLSVNFGRDDSEIAAPADMPE